MGKAQFTESQIVAILELFASVYRLYELEYRFY